MRNKKFILLCLLLPMIVFSVFAFGEYNFTIGFKRLVAKRLSKEIYTRQLADPVLASSVIWKAANLFNQYLAIQIFRLTYLSNIGHSNKMDWLIEALTISKSVMYTHEAVLFEPSFHFDFLLGLAWCDQMNGNAARIIAPYFDRAEVFALRDKYGASNHSIGRVYDKDNTRWIYFDIWPRTIFIYTQKFGQAPEFFTYGNQGYIHKGAEMKQFFALYTDETFSGVSLGEFGATFLGHLFARFKENFLVEGAIDLAEFSPKPNKTAECSENDRDHLNLADTDNPENTLQPAQIIGSDYLESYIMARLELLSGHLESELTNYEHIQRTNLSLTKQGRDLTSLINYRLKNIETSLSNSL